MRNYEETFPNSDTKIGMDLEDRVVFHIDWEECINNIMIYILKLSNSLPKLYESALWENCYFLGQSSKA